MTLERLGYKELALSMIPVAQQAGAAIMDIYRSSPNVRYKTDSSPVTDADHAAEEIILRAISKLLPNVPVIAEEQAAAGNIPSTNGQFFLVDPLDGTKEFLKGNGEFTVNIALVTCNKPLFGLIYAPDKSDCYLTLNPGEAVRFHLDPAHNPQPRQTFDFERLTGEAQAGRALTAVVSRSAVRPQAQAFLEKLPVAKRMPMGSSLKFCVLARGNADVYPGFGPTSEWDIAAGQAILDASGGSVMTPDGKPVDYGKRDRGFVNPSFIAWRRSSDAKRFSISTEPPDCLEAKI